MHYSSSQSTRLSPLSPWPRLGRCLVPCVENPHSAVTGSGQDDVARVGDGPRRAEAGFGARTFILRHRGHDHQAAVIADRVTGAG